MMLPERLVDSINRRFLNLAALAIVFVVLTCMLNCQPAKATITIARQFVTTDYGEQYVAFYIGEISEKVLDHDAYLIIETLDHRNVSTDFAKYPYQWIAFWHLQGILDVPEVRARVCYDDLGYCEDWQKESLVCTANCPSFMLGDKYAN